MLDLRRRNCWPQPMAHPGIAAALVASVLFGAGTPLAKLLLTDVSPAYWQRCSTLGPARRDLDRRGEGPGRRQREPAAGTLARQRAALGDGARRTDPQELRSPAVATVTPGWLGATVPRRPVTACRHLSWSGIGQQWVDRSQSHGWTDDRTAVFHVERRGTRHPPQACRSFPAG